MLRWLTAGESHGPELVAILEGLPAGVPVSLDQVRADLARRKLGYGRGARMKFEEDELAFSSGVRFGLSMGSPIALRIGNTEWPRWVDVMSAEPVDLDDAAEGTRRRPHPAAAGSRRPRRHAEVRFRRGPQRARARQRPGDRGPGGARRRGALLPRRARHPAREPHAVHRPGARPRRVAAAALPTTSTLLDADPLRCFDPATSARMVAEVDERPEGRRHARRRRRGARLRCFRPGSARTCTGIADSTRSWPAR